VRALRSATALLVVHPVVALGLGGALLLSLGAVCCGLGLIAAPWFVCELMAMVLGTARGRRISRHRGWLGAGFIQAAAVVVSTSAVVVSVTWLGTQLPVSPLAPLTTAGAGQGQVLALVAGGSAVALVYMLPYLYAPLLLIEQGGSLGGALVHSASRVVRGGLGAHFLLSSASHFLQVLPPALAAGAVLAVGDPVILPLVVGLSLPAMALTIPMGQAMIVASYAERVPPDRPMVAPPVGRPLAVGFALVGLAPAVALLLIVAAVTVRPSMPSPGSAPLGDVVAGGALGSQVSTFPVPHTALEVHASRTHLSIHAGDGGGAGALPQPPDARFDRLRVIRVRDAYAVEVGSDAMSYLTWIDRAGVRLDDDLPARLDDHLPRGGLVVLALAMLATALLFGPALERLASGVGSAKRRAWWVVGLLLPLNVAALALGVHAAFV
jgi:hypothetical protein